MQVTTTPIAGLLVIEPKVLTDDRGYFFESYNMQALLQATGYDVPFVQDNQVRSVKNVLRGLHYQNLPSPQAKLIRVLEGAIWDVAVDIRKSSSTFGKWFGVELTAENRKQLLVPHGFAHGYAVLSEIAEVFYKCDSFYNKSVETGIYFADPAINVDWKMETQVAIISEKDQRQPMFKDAWNTFE